MRRAVVSSNLKAGTYTVVNSPDLSREVHHFQWGRKLQEDGALCLFSQSCEDTSLHTCLLFTQTWNQPCCNLQHLCSLLELSAAIQPSMSQRCCVGSWKEKYYTFLSCLLLFLFFNIRAFMSSQALFSWWLKLSRYQIWNKIVYSSFCHATSHSSMSFTLHIKSHWLLMNHTMSFGTNVFLQSNR